MINRNTPPVTYSVRATNGEDCGHKHKTVEAAKTCQQKMLNYPDTAAYQWAHYHIIDQDGNRVN